MRKSGRSVRSDRNKMQFLKKYHNINFAVQNVFIKWVPSTIARNRKAPPHISHLTRSNRNAYRKKLDRLQYISKLYSKVPLNIFTFLISHAHTCIGEGCCEVGSTAGLLAPRTFQQHLVNLMSRDGIKLCHVTIVNSVVTVHDFFVLIQKYFQSIFRKFVAIRSQKEKLMKERQQMWYLFKKENVFLIPLTFWTEPTHRSYSNWHADWAAR